MSLRHNGKKGYRLHDERIAYSGCDGSIRSIKYELKDPDGVVGLRDKIAAAIEEDNKWLYGNINLNNYLEWRSTISDKDVKDGVREYSFLGFWIKALSLGFVFSKQAHAIFDFSFSSDDKNRLFERIPESLQNELDKERWLAFFKSRDDGKTNIKGVFKKDAEETRNIFIKKYQELEKGHDRAAKRIKLFIPDYEEKLSKNFPEYQKKPVSWHCYPDLKFKEKDPTKLLDEIINYYNQKYSITENTKDDETSNRMALYSLNQGYMQHFLGSFFQFVRDGKFEEYLSDVKSFFKYSESEIEKIREKLLELNLYAKQIPERPQLVNKWFEYRCVFGGALESWYLNRARKLKEIPEQITELYELLEDIEKVLEKQNNAKDELEILHGLKKKIADYRIFKEKSEETVFSWKIKKYDKKKKENVEEIYFVRKLADRNFTEDISSWLADLRSQLNDYNQQNVVRINNKNIGILDANLNKSARDEDKKTKVGWQDKLGKKIQSAPLCFGETSRNFWEEVYNLKFLIKQEIEEIIRILNSRKSDLKNINIECSVEDKDKRQGGDKTVNSLARIYSRFFDKNYKGNNYIKSVLEKIAKELKTDFAKYGEVKGKLAPNEKGAGRFYLSGKERQSFNLISFNGVITAEELLKISNLEVLLEKAKTEFNNENYLRDLVLLSKTISAVCLKNANKEDQIKLNISHSKLSGYVSIISKTRVISRYQLQSVGSSGSNKTDNVTAGGNQVTLGIGKGISKKGKSVDRYFYAFKYFNVDENLKTQLSKICIAKDNTKSPETDVKPIVNKKYPALQIFSSKYQIQFLDWFFGNKKEGRVEKNNLHQKKKTDLKILGPFTILEKTIDFDWTGNNPKSSVAGHPRIFVSQPFEILSRTEKEFSLDKIKNRFIGVDIGEYALAWSLIEVNDKKVTQLESGLITDNQQRVLKDSVKSWRRDQVRQTFTSPNTKIARLRESLIGSYRNQLENLVLSKNAKISFEYQVSGFEVGSNKVAKIYDSIKRGFIQRGSDNKPQNTQSWGKINNSSKEFNWGIEVSASGTSQTCSKCKRWASLEIEDDKDYQVEPYNDGLLKAKINDHAEVRLLGQQNMDRKIKGRDLKKLIYKAMRPNIDGLGMEIVKRKLGDGFYELKTQHGQGKPRGNMGIFICPYTDCHHISDADKQAAFNIAVRGYIKSINHNNLSKNKDLPKFFNKEQSELEFKEVEL